MSTVLITGTNKGIGREMLNQYLEAGWTVIACTRKPEQIKIKHEKLRVVEVDVSREDHIQRLVQEMKDIPLDLLINNAGIVGPSNLKLGSVEPASWLEVFKVNTIAPLMMAQALLPNIVQGKLKIIANISSAMGSISENASGGRYIYRTSKAALNMVTKTLSVDLRNQGITVVSLHPGWVKTDMGGTDALLTPKESVERIRNVLASVSLAESGSFIRYDGTKASW